MQHGTETKQDLLISAKQEFMEKGYAKASLRNICKNAGVTTGALYFFFRDKQDLFSALVKEPLQQLEELMQRHYSAEQMVAEEKEGVDEEFSDDVAMSKRIVHFLFENRDAFVLLLTKSQGSEYESYVAHLADFTSRHYRELTDELTTRNHKERMADSVVHWMAHMHIDIFVYLLEHMETEEQAQEAVDGIMAYALGGWYYMVM